MNNIPNNDRGAIAVMVAMLLVVLIGFLGLAVDFGYAYLQKTTLQTVADAEALACVTNPAANPCPKTGGDVYPVVNPSGFVISILNPGDSSLCPLPNAQINCAKATAGFTWSTFFISLFGIKTINLSATATAGLMNQNPCMLSMNGTGTGISMTGSASINTINCGIGVNQTGISISLVGSGSITASPINVMGAVSKVGSGFISPTTMIHSPIVDPFAGQSPPVYAQPPPSSCTMTTQLSYTGSSAPVVPAGNYCGGVSKVGSGSITLNPGYYSGISTTGSASVIFNPGNYVIYGNGLNLNGSGNVSFGAGNYVLVGGGFNLTGSGNVSGTAITIFNTGSAAYPAGPLNVTGSGSFNLSAPSSGAQQGMLFFQPASNTNAVSIVGSGGSVFNGNLYFPAASLSITGSAGATLPFGVIIAKDISMTGSGTISVTNAFLPAGGTSSTKPILVN